MENIIKAIIFNGGRSQQDKGPNGKNFFHSADLIQIYVLSYPC